MSNTRLASEKLPWIHLFMQQLVDPKAMQDHYVFGASTGVCFGVAMMAIQAIAIGQLDQFDQRVNDMFTLYLRHEVNAASVDMLAFLNGVEIYHQPFEHPELFSPEKRKSLHQSVSLALPLTASYQLKKQGGLITMMSMIGAYTKTELLHYFTSLQCVLENSTIDQPISLLLRNADHAIAINYSKDKQTWYLIDANSLPVKKFTSTLSLSEAVHHAFGNEMNSIFSSTIYSIGISSLEISQFSAMLQTNHQWQTLHFITPEKVARKDSKGTSCLSLAALNGDQEHASSLLAEGAKVDAATFDNMTPLWIAANKGHSHLVGLLACYNANINTQHRDGRTALFTAAKQGDIKTVKILIRHGAKTDITRTDDGATALYAAAANNQPEIVAFLLRHGANPNMATTSLHLTPLAIAAWSGHKKVVEVLLSNKQTKINITSANNQLPHELAKNAGHDEIASIIKNANKGARTAGFFSTPVNPKEKSISLGVAAYQHT